LTIYGASAINGRGGFFFRTRGILSFYVSNLVPDDVTITKIIMNWQSSGDIDFVYDVYDDTIDQYWLPGDEGPYFEDLNYTIAAAQGGIVISNTVDHHLTIRFNYGNRPEGDIFTFSFYIIEYAAWETIVINNV